MGPIAFIVTSILIVIAVLVLIRFILQASRADFYNPISQGVARFTDPMLRPVKTVVPTFRNFELSAIVVAWVLCALTEWSIAIDRGISIGALSVLVEGLERGVELFLNIYWVAILAMIILSFLAPGTYNPIAALLHQVTEPVLAPARRILPPMGGLDLSPILVFLGLGLLNGYLLPAIFEPLKRVAAG